MNARARAGALPCTDAAPYSFSSLGTLLVLPSSSERNATLSRKPPLRRSSLATASPSRLPTRSLKNPSCSPIICGYIVTLVDT